MNIRTTDSKSGFQSYLDQYNCKYPGVLGGEGGSSISSAVGNSSGNPKYLIRPDKSYGSYSSLPSTVQPHECNPSPAITVIYPNGDEILMQGTEYEIKWSSKKITGAVKIELMNGSSVETVISSSEENDGSYMWDLTSAFSTGNSYGIKISSLSDPSVADASDDAFTIKEEIIIDGDYTENFDTLDSGLEELPLGYVQSTSDDFNWLVLSGPTPSKGGSSPNVTGPDGDHTSGGADGNYLYVEASNPNNPGKSSDFVTPKINIAGLQNPDLTFYYHMFSDSGHMGSLAVDVCEDGAWTNDEVVLDDSDYGDEWKEMKVDLSAYRTRSDWIKFRFRAVTGASWASDICIDDIAVKGNPVAISKTGSLKNGLTLKQHKSNLLFSIPQNVKTGLAKLTVFNMQGKEVFKSVRKISGDHERRIDLGTDIANGVYTARLKVGAYETSMNFMLSN